MKEYHTRFDLFNKKMETKSMNNILKEIAIGTACFAAGYLTHMGVAYLAAKKANETDEEEKPAEEAGK